MISSSFSFRKFHLQVASLILALSLAACSGTQDLSGEGEVDIQDGTAIDASTKSAGGGGSSTQVPVNGFSFWEGGKITLMAYLNTQGDSDPSNDRYELCNHDEGNWCVYSTIGDNYPPTTPEEEEYGGEPRVAVVSSEDETFGNGQFPLTYEQAVIFDDPNASPLVGTISSYAETSAVDVHHGVEMIWNFYHEFLGRNGGVFGDGLPLLVYVNILPDLSGSETTTNQTLAYYSDGRLFFFIPQNQNHLWTEADTRRFQLFHPEMVSHEYTHGVISAHLETGENPYEFGTLAWQEYRSIDEGLADIFAIASYNWNNMQRDPATYPSNESNVDWLMYRDKLFRANRTHDWYLPSDEPGMLDWYDTNLILNSHFHRVRGIIRHVFFYLGHGVKEADPANPYPGANSEDAALESLYLSRGFGGIGMMNAAKLFYETMVSESGTYPDLHAFREAAVRRASNESWGGVCSTTQKAVMDAFAAVNIGERADREVATVDLSVRQEANAVKVTVTLTDPTDPSATPEIPENASLWVDGVNTAPIAFAGSQAIVTLPLFSLSNGAHVFQSVVEDDCHNGNAKTVTRTIFRDRTVVISKSGLPKQPLLTPKFSDNALRSKAEFFVDGSTVPIVVNASPFEKTFDTSTWTDGSHPVRVRLTDTSDNTFEGTYTLVADNTPPTVTGFSSSTGNPPFLLTATATDPSGITQAAFYKDANPSPLTIDTTSPYNANYTPTDNNNHTLKVVFRDAYGNEGNSTITAPRDQTPPTATLTATQSATNMLFNATNMIDTCGGVNWTMFIDSVSVATGTASSWAGSVPSYNYAPGSHLFSADVRDNCGNTRHVDKPFTVVATAPTVTIDPVQVDALHPKRPKITVRAVSDRPIKKIEIWRTHGPSQTQLKIAEWTSNPGELLPIREFVLNTSAVGWETGYRQIQAIAFDHLNIPGQATTQVAVDNTAPGLTVGWTSVGPVAAGIHAEGTDTIGTADNMKELRTGAFLLGPEITRTFAPWKLDFVASIPSNYSSFGVVSVSTAKDKYGNTRSQTWQSDASCSGTGSQRSCSFTQPVLLQEDVSEHEDP